MPAGKLESSLWLLNTTVALIFPAGATEHHLISSDDTNNFPIKMSLARVPCGTDASLPRYAPAVKWGIYVSLTELRQWSRCDFYVGLGNPMTWI